MRISKRKLCSFLAAAAFCSGPVVGQTLEEMTLDFNNITTTNVVQTVAESNQGNEKEVEFGDIDNDGDQDIVVAVGEGDFGTRRNKMYRNDNGVLVEITNEQIDGVSIIAGFSAADVSRNAFLRDYNLDGRLDIIITNDRNASGTAGLTKLFVQNEDGIFIDATPNLDGIAGAACSGISEDFDNDGTYDLYHCNYPNSSRDTLILNAIGEGGAAGIFTQVTGDNAPLELLYGVHSEGADMNGDGKIDALVANWTRDPSFIYYNNNMNMGSGDGDFRYGGDTISTDTVAQTRFAPIGSAGDERAMFPVDINGDGLLDMYFTNYGIGGNNARADFLFINEGNDANNKATFSTIQMPNNLNFETHKVTTTDLDNDGSQDFIVMSEFRRPVIYRNLSTEDDIKVIEWTPANIDVSLEGWMANSTDLTGNERNDIFFGSDVNDHLFENIPVEVVDADTLTDGFVPSFHNSSPVAISGMVNDGETQTFIVEGGVSGVPTGATVSIVVRSEGDVDLSTIGTGNATSARLGEGIPEGVQVLTQSNGALVVNVTGVSGGLLLGDLNGDGLFNLLDVGPFVDLLSETGFDPAADFNGDGAVNLLDVRGFVDGLTNPDDATAGIRYVIEFLSRT